MGWIEERGSGVRAVWRENGRKVSILCTTKAEARTVLAQVTADRSRGTYIDIGGGAMTVAEWSELWMQGRPHLKASSAVADEGRMKLHIIPRLGRHRLDAVTPLVVRKWVADLLKSGMAPKTARNCHGLLYSLMQGAVDERLIPTNPCRSTKLPEVETGERYFLTRQECDRLVAAVPEHYRPLIVTMIGTGLRWGEAAGLRHKRVDVLGGKLEVAEALHETGGRLVYGSPKSKASRRVIPLPAYLQTVLAEVADAGAKPDDPFFTTERGGLLRRTNFGRRIWIPALRQAGLPVGHHDEDKVWHPGVRVHDLRHTHASHLIAQGVPLTAIQRRMGHASIKVTSDVYGHLLPETEATTLAALESAFAPTVPPRAQNEVPAQVEN